MARTKRQASAGDMVRTLVVILLPVLVIVALFTRGPDELPVQPVDWRPVLAEARAEAPYPVLAPEGLPETWRATSVSWVRTGEPALNGDPAQRNTWRLGFLTPEDVYVGLAQGDLRRGPFVDEVTRDGIPNGESRIGSDVWIRFLSADERTRSLVRETDVATSIVVSDGSYELLETYVSTLATR